MTDSGRQKDSSGLSPEDRYILAEWLRRITKERLYYLHDEELQLMLELNLLVVCPGVSFEEIASKCFGYQGKCNLSATAKKIEQRLKN